MQIRKSGMPVVLMGLKSSLQFFFKVNKLKNKSEIWKSETDVGDIGWKAKIWKCKSSDEIFNDELSDCKVLTLATVFAYLSCYFKLDVVEEAWEYHYLLVHFTNGGFEKIISIRTEIMVYHKILLCLGGF